MRIRRFVIALATVGCLTTVAACGTDNQAQPAAKPAASGSEMPGMSMSPAPAAGPAVVADAVDIKEFAFGPQDITVKVGTTVTWTNDDQDPHTVTSQNGDGPLKSSTLQKGDKYEYKFTKAGTFGYLCTIHPFMTGTVVVTA
ncbi:cupredoxin family copper-binding protein [Kribbella ginsengisoli]|uniref:Blue (type 1) copper domain-containing protein n=1 Tax=Kribbella ginsengisoli TaxID=363865 RepID=A0ABP6Z1K2_9ACTN